MIRTMGMASRVLFYGVSYGMGRLGFGEAIERIEIELAKVRCLDGLVRDNSKADKC